MWPHAEAGARVVWLLSVRQCSDVLDRSRSTILKILKKKLIYMDVKFTLANWGVSHQDRNEFAVRNNNGGKENFVWWLGSFKNHEKKYPQSVTLQIILQIGF